MILVSTLPLLVWLYLVAFHGRFWSSRPMLPAGTPCGRPRVAVVAPARNEEESIARSLASLLSQDFPGALSIILVDDNSTDRTAEIAASFSDQRLSIVAGEPLPAGWSGKLWAVHQGLNQPAAGTADYVLLTDADIIHAPGHVSALVAKAQREGLDLVSEMVRLNCDTPAERSLIPAFVFFFQMLYPFAWVTDPGKRTAGAAGGTMLIARATLDRVEGVTRIRHELIDDCALAREIKSSGGRIWLGHAELAVSTRVYAQWRDIWNMIARTAYTQLRYSPLLLAGCMAGMGAIYCAPPLLALLAHGVPRISGMVSWLIMATSYQPTLHRYRRSPLWGPVLPCVALFYLGATVASAVRHHAGCGGRWKDRVYPETN